MFSGLLVHLKVQFILKRSTVFSYCDHKPLEPFLSCDMKINKCNHWSIEISDYNLIFIHIKGSNNILADAISRMKTPDIYEDLKDYTKTFDTMTCIADGYH